ncbi:MAG: hypothetical protein KJO94_01810 [Eudoraea sp.]|nr:hypothetical protein [Eudoraea sp.]
METKYKEDLREIRDIMNRSSRFISLSGLSGISAGILGLAGAYLGWKYILTDPKYLSYEPHLLPDSLLTNLLILAAAMLLLAIGTTLMFTQLATRKKQQKAWDQQAKRLLVNLFIPLVCGGLLCAILLFKGFVGMALALCLVFYGLALINASKYTLNEVRVLGLVQIVLGLVAFLFIEYALLLWAVGFGGVHIVYGSIMNLKYKS